MAEKPRQQEVELGHSRKKIKYDGCAVLPQFLIY